MVKQILSFVCCCICTIVALSQSEYSAEYLHGFGKNFNSNSIGARYEEFNTSKNSWSLGINYTFSLSRSGKALTKGRGIGIYANYRYGLKYGLSGDLFGGIRTLFTFSKESNGKNYSVFTPSLETGYHYTSQDFGKGGAFTPFIAWGYDIKMSNKKDRSLNEGSLLVAGISVGYRL